jgi:RNA polymerase-binding transcription factor DksA
MNKQFDKKFIEEQKEKLLGIKQQLERELRHISRKEKGENEEWELKYPQFDKNSSLEEEADEVEEYENLLPVNYALEQELAKVDKSLKKIHQGTYGTCEKCGKKINKKRLKAYPQANYCIKCSE